NVDRAYPDQATLEQTAEDAEDENDDSPGNPEAETRSAEPDIGNDAPRSDGGGVAAATTEAAAGPTPDGDSEPCPDCGSLALYYSEGCKTCESCGWSEC
ncbi:MAG: hypothetical protein ABEH64_06150, partial [Salinirussus sp.]